MKITLFRLLCIGAATAGAATAGTHVGIGLSFGGPVYVRHAPPHAVVERVVVAPTPAPGPGYVWLPGHYSWAGDHWTWVAAAWVVPPRADARWVYGSWNPQTQQWIEGHWELPATPAVTVVTPVTPAPVANEIVIAEPPPPAPEMDVHTIAPGPGYVWISGYWGWESGHRVWMRAHWELPPHGYTTWVSPRWEHRPHGYVFIHGRWM